MKLLILNTVFLCLVGSAYSCIPTYPGGAGCCPINVYNEAAATGRALFNPQLSQCPDTANFICSVAVDGSTNPTMIVINGGTTVTTGANGQNSQVILTCRKATRTWTYTGSTGTATNVNQITCLNNAAG
ncbi:unnamed protein product, partial [Mesorhabditis spiculigera]